MKKTGFIAALVLAASLLVGCSTVAPLAATSNELGSKVGTASAGYLFGLIPIPFSADYGIEKAARDGGITKISTVDVKSFNYFGVWVGHQTIVTGE